MNAICSYSWSCLTATTGAVTVGGACTTGNSGKSHTTGVPTIMWYTHTWISLISTRVVYRKMGNTDQDHQVCLERQQRCATNEKPLNLPVRCSSDSRTTLLLDAALCPYELHTVCHHRRSVKIPPILGMCLQKRKVRRCSISTSGQSVYLVHSFQQSGTALCYPQNKSVQAAHQTVSSERDTTEQIAKQLPYLVVPIV